ncbi:hypothetical protein, partial [Paracoccus sanguinis]|uniref:hypothetical protein n=1 Tax=Paracoccus sanguinis TaxID=1545044 RepID=UPI001E2D4856
GDLRGRVGAAGGQTEHGSEQDGRGDAHREILMIRDGPRRRTATGSEVAAHIGRIARKQGAQPDDRTSP